MGYPGIGAVVVNVIEFVVDVVVDVFVVMQGQCPRCADGCPIGVLCRGFPVTVTDTAVDGLRNQSVHDLCHQLLSEGGSSRLSITVGDYDGGCASCVASIKFVGCGAGTGTGTSCAASIKVCEHKGA